MLSDLQRKGHFLSETKEKPCPASAQEASPLASFCDPRLNVINSILCTEFCQFHSHGVVRIYSVSWRNAGWNEMICTPVLNRQKRSVPAPGAVMLQLSWFINQVPVHSPAQPHVQLWRVSWLYFFFCSHLIPQTQLKVETLMWCQVRDQFIYTDVLVVSLHLYNLFKIPRFLVSLSCTMSAIRSECQLATTERTKRTERQKWLETNGGWCYSTAAPLTPASQGLSPLQRFKRSSSHYFGLLHLPFAVLPQLVLWFAPKPVCLRSVLTSSLLSQQVCWGEQASPIEALCDTKDTEYAE